MNKRRRMNADTPKTLIFCGVALLALPYVNNVITLHAVADTMVTLGKGVNMSGVLPRHANVFCMFIGVLMIVTGTVAGLRGSRVDDSPSE